MPCRWASLPPGATRPPPATCPMTSLRGCARPDGPAAGVAHGDRRRDQRPARPTDPGYWAYFVLHALNFLESGGRLALVLPAAFLNANYAAPVRLAFSDHFGRVRLALVRERLFENVDESAIVVLAEGWRGGPANCSISLLEKAADLVHWCANGRAAATPLLLSHRTNGWRQSLLSPTTRSALDEIASLPGVGRLGTFARIRIGTVTGANRYFVLSAKDLLAAELPKSVLKWVLDGGSRLRGLDVTVHDLERALLDGQRVKIFLPKARLLSKGARVYVESPQGQAAAKAAHCRRRKPWYVINDVEVPDAVLTYVNHRAPRLVLNAAGALCTNALHRLWWMGPRSCADQRLIALSFVSSLTGLSAELYGRSYGGGILKLEIAETASLYVAIPPMSRIGNVMATFAAASALMRRGDWKAARAMVDEAILHRGMGLGKKTIAELTAAQDALHHLRVRQ